MSVDVAWNILIPQSWLFINKFTAPIEPRILFINNSVTKSQYIPVQSTRFSKAEDRGSYPAGQGRNSRILDGVSNRSTASATPFAVAIARKKITF